MRYFSGEVERTFELLIIMFSIWRQKVPEGKCEGVPRVSIYSNGCRKIYAVSLYNLRLFSCNNKNTPIIRVFYLTIGVEFKPWERRFILLLVFVFAMVINTIIVVIIITIFEINNSFSNFFSNFRVFF